ncbi:amidohydrolase [Desulfobacterales bacterium HSG16]|nr:amidohydrolase [Desulfobacterales bacterium HSG16]
MNASSLLLNRLGLRMDPVQKRIHELMSEIIDLRRDFHMFPELGFAEFDTAKKIEQYLRNLGYSTTRMADTGVVALLDSGRPGPCLMLRADMDALPITEANNDLPYKSKNDGVMHACGHDAHMAMLLVAAKVLEENQDMLTGKIKFVFQPNEEVAGAIELVEQGVLENPEVDGVMGLHVWSQIPSGRVSISPGVVMGGLDVFKIKVKGKGGHTGYPHEAIDPVIAAANIIQSVQAVQTREMDAQNPIVIMFGKLAAGEKSNIIPEEVYMEGTIRFLHDDPDDSQGPTKRFIRICESVCQAFQCICEIKIEHENIPLVNDENMVDLAKKTAMDVFGRSDIIDAGRYIASEDFSEYSARVPGVFIFLGCGNKEKNTDIPLHNPKFNVDEDILIKGVEFHVKGALEFLKEK